MTGAAHRGADQPRRDEGARDGLDPQSCGVPVSHTCGVQGAKDRGARRRRLVDAAPLSRMMHTVRSLDSDLPMLMLLSPFELECRKRADYDGHISQ